MAGACSPSRRSRPRSRTPPRAAAPQRRRSRSPAGSTDATSAGGSSRAVPELPEAETIVRALRQRLPGARVRGVSVKHADVLAPGLTPRRLAAALRGRRFTGVERRGKNVVLEFEGDLRLVINLGMTGRVVTSEATRAAELRHVAVRFALDDGRTLLYDDARRFGCL